MKALPTKRLLAYFKKLRKSYQIWNQIIDPEEYYGLTLDTLTYLRDQAKKELNTRENIVK